MSFSALDSAITGPLFRSDEMAAIFSDRNRLSAMLRSEEALARAQARHGLVPPALADALAAIDPAAFDLAALGRETALAGVPVIPFVKAVQKSLPRDLEPSFHFGATTQDIADTALALQMRDAFQIIARDLGDVIGGMSALAHRYKDTPCIGRTYMQHAAPITFGTKIAARLANILHVADALPDLMRKSLLASLGGPVGTLAACGDKGPDIVAEFAHQLRLAIPPIAMHGQRAPFVEIATWLAALCGALGAFGSDVVHLASTEIAEVSEPYIPGRGGSSAMPHKRNPVSATILVSAATAAPGLASTMLSAMIASHERPAGAWHAEWHALPQLFGLVSGALTEARRLADGLVVDPRRMQANIEITHGLIFADAVSSALAPTRGRAQAYALVEAAANRVRVEPINLRDALLASALTDGERSAVDAAFRLEPAIANSAQWVTPVLAKAESVRAALAKTMKDA